MSDKPTPPPDEPKNAEFKRFKRFARAIFQVDKRDVPKHVPAKRNSLTKS
jgi:hypothetical protein